MLYFNQSGRYFFFLGVCAKVLAAADLDLALDLPSLRTFEAADAALDEVCLLGALVWDNALPEAVFDFLPVLLDFKFDDAFDATFLLVTFLFIFISLGDIKNTLSLP